MFHRARTVNEKYEKRALRQIAKALDQPGRRRRYAKGLGFALYAIAAVLIIGAFLLVSRGLLSGAWGVVAGTFGGICVGMASYLGTAMKQWSVVSIHIDRDSIEKRLNELET